MKKSMLFAAAAVVAMVGCTNEDFTGFQNKAEKGEMAINFGSVGKTVTRADKTGADAATLLNNNFVVEGVKSDGTLSAAVEVFKYYSVNYTAGSANSTESNTNGWEYVGQTPVSKSNFFIAGVSMSPVNSQTIKYWDFAKTQYDFVAFSQGKGYTPTSGTATYAKFSEVNVANIGTTSAVYEVSGSVNELTSAYVADLVTVYQADFGKTVVTPKFRTMGSKVRMGIYETIPGYSVKDVQFYVNATSLATTPGNATLFTKDAAKTLAGGTGKMSVSFPVAGSGNVTAEGYNVANITFTADNANNNVSSLDFAALSNFAGAEKDETAGTTYLGRTSSAATYAGDATANYYTVVLPTGVGQVLNLKVNYTLVPIDGGVETITVTGATAQVPSVYTNWQPNYAYTYIFKISDQTNGQTGSGTTPAGLYPITFDAVVMDSEDGIQETITEVGKPAITTYQKGEVVTKNDEYIAGSNIYVDVNDANDSETLTKETEVVGGVSLFTATVENGAIQSITEASVANCFTNGVFNSTAGTYTVTDSKDKAANKKLVLTRASGALALSATIDDEDAPHGVTVTPAAGNFAVITPVAHTNYVFQYKTALAEYEAATATTLTYNETYYTLDKSGFLHKFTAKGNEIIKENTYYTITATAVTANETLTTGNIYYTSATADGGFVANGTEVATGTNYYTIASTAVATTAGTTLTAGSIYYKDIDPTTKVGTKVIAVGDEPISGYSVCKQNAQYAYKVIIVQ